MTVPLIIFERNINKTYLFKYFSSNWFPLLELYNVTYGWYGVIGIFSSLIINIVVSLISSIIMEVCVNRGWTYGKYFSTGLLLLLQKFITDFIDIDFNKP